MLKTQMPFIPTPSATVNDQDGTFENYNILRMSGDKGRTEKNKTWNHGKIIVGMERRSKLLK